MKAPGGDKSDLGARFEAPEEPWTEQYGEAHRSFLTAMFDDPSVIGDFRDQGELPSAYGRGLDERVIEYPWLLSQGIGGNVLDAGSVLNHSHVLERVLPSLESLTIVTLEPEAESFSEQGINYTYADLRQLPFANESFDVVVCLSTIEHVGMDNRIYGSSTAIAEEPELEARRALEELLRALKPGGNLLLSVPYGRKEDHGWFHQFDAASLNALLTGTRAETQFFRYTEAGWERAASSDCAECEYRDYHADRTHVDDLAAAARAVACIRIEKPGPEAPRVDSTPMDAEAKLEQIEALGPWYQNIDLGDGITTKDLGDETQIFPGADIPDALWREIEPHLGDIKGDRVLDIGCNAGYMSFKCKQLGASEVLGVDSNLGAHISFLRQAEFCREALGLDVEFREQSFFELEEDSFDLVIFCGVLYHLENFASGLDKLLELVKPGGRVILETASEPITMTTYGTGYHGDTTTFFVPSMSVLIALVEERGFTVEVERSLATRALLFLRAPKA